MTFVLSGVYFLTVPSLNIPGAGHRVVLYDDHAQNEWVILDPNSGRPGKEVYPSNVLHTHRGQIRFCYTEVTFLKPLGGHKGAEERYRRYLDRASEHEVAAEL